MSHSTVEASKAETAAWKKLEAHLRACDTDRGTPIDRRGCPECRALYARHREALREFVRVSRAAA